jgi:hypothetical protein
MGRKFHEITVHTHNSEKRSKRERAQEFKRDHEIKREIKRESS